MRVGISPGLFPFSSAVSQSFRDMEMVLLLIAVERMHYAKARLYNDGQLYLYIKLNNHQHTQELTSDFTTINTRRR